jgi:large subunit ribosomal protein L6
MSRIGKQPVAIPSGVQVATEGNSVTVEGPLGKLSFTHRPEVRVAVDAEKGIVIERTGDEKQIRAFHGLTRALLQNMVIGVTKGYEKKLEIVGVGYLAAVQEQTLQLRVGFANEVHKTIPQGLDVTCPDQTHIVVKGSDKQMVGQFAAEVRAVRKPEPYKGKGIRYTDEYVRRKAGKAVGA